MMMSSLYQTNTLSWIFIELAHWNRHVIPIPSQPIFALTPQCCLLSREATNSNFIMFIVFGVTWPGLKPIIYLHSRQAYKPLHHCCSSVPLSIRISYYTYYWYITSSDIWLEAGRWFSPHTPVFSRNKTDRHDITEILLNVALNTINHQPINRYLIYLC
jgi:hypothetical protein